MARDGGYTSPENMAMILEVVRYLKRNGFVIRGQRETSQFIPPEAPIYIRNDTGEEIPPFGCVQCSGTVEQGGQNYITVVKPVDDTGAAGGFLFNSIAPIGIDDNSKYGIAYAGPLARMLTDGSTVTCGASWKPDVGEFAIIPGGSIFTAIGEDDIETNVMRGLYKGGGTSGASLFGARMTENWTSRQATCEIYTLDGANDPVYVDNQEVYDPLSIFAALGSGDWMKVGLNPDGKYYVVAANCPDTSPFIADPPATQP
jgi:hypothetical protein